MSIIHHKLCDLLSGGRCDCDAASANDRQVGGDHYKTPIEPWDFVAANNLGYFEGSVIKYITRWRKKGGMQDLEKAKHYLEKLMEIERAANP